MKKIIENILFGSRWLLILFYFGLIIALGSYAYTYTVQIVHMISNMGKLTSELTMALMLELVDIVMIANLVKMIITGSYHAFIDKNHNYTDEKASSGFLKVKIATSLISVAAIHLLQSFVAHDISPEKLYRQLIIFGAFVVGGIALAFIEYLHDRTLLDNKTETH